MDLQYQEELDKGKIPDTLRQRFEKGWEPYYTKPISPETAFIAQEKGSRWLIVDGGSQFCIQKSNDALRMHANIPSTHHRLDIEEAVGDPEQIVQVLGILARQSRSEVNDHGHLAYFDRLPYRSALGKRLRQMDTCRISYKERGDGNSYMIRIVNLKSLFEKLSPELSHRLSRSPLANWQGDLLISNGEEEIALIIEDSKVEVAAARETKHTIRGGQEIAQLIVGTDAPREVAQMNHIDLGGDAGQLIEVLFPAQDPQMRNQDL